jgi:hypothetical protein
MRLPCQETGFDHTDGAALLLTSYGFHEIRRNVHGSCRIGSRKNVSSCSFFVAAVTFDTNIEEVQNRVICEIVDRDNV